MLLAEGKIWECISMEQTAISILEKERLDEIK